MDISPTGLIRNWLPYLPTVLRTAVLAALQQTPQSEHQDWLTQVIVQFARPVLRNPTALLKSQIQFNQDFGIWGRMWVAKYTVPRPSERCHKDDLSEGYDSSSTLSLRQAVAFAIEKLDCSSHEQLATATKTSSWLSPSPSALDIPDLIDVETEWTAYRSNATYFSQRPSGLSEAEMYDAMVTDPSIDKDGPVILYFHGGAFCLMDPATERLATAPLAGKAHGRVLAVRYRLAPQNMFPAALLDAFMVFLDLLYPSKNAFHRPIPASQIVLAGDSSGAGLAASLQLLLLTLSRQDGLTVQRHDGKAVKILNPPCAGLALASPWLDVSRCLPSTTENAVRWDFLAPPPLDAASPPFPPDAIWPCSPPRAETYCTADMVSHPLVSPLAATPSQWAGCPPLFVCVGWEAMQDEIEVFARRVFASTDQATVIFDGYEGMPHCFAMFPWNSAGRTAQDNWGAFCQQVVKKDEIPKRRSVARWTSSKTGTVKEIDLTQLGLSNYARGYDRIVPLTDEVVEEKMSMAREWRMKLEAGMLREWKSLPLN